MPNHRTEIEISSDKGVENHISRRFIDVPGNASKGIQLSCRFSALIAYVLWEI